ncbi:MAG: hypothetical protein QM479_16665 [Pseudomonadota bacterium]
MGILDELRDEAERKKIVEQQQTISSEKLEEIYQQNLLPKMQKIFDFFKEIVNHLQYLQDPIKVENYSNKYAQLGDLIQQDYKLSTDQYGGMGHYNSLKTIYLRFYCIGEDIMEFDVKTQADIEHQINFLTSKKISFDWSRHYSSVESSSATFRVKRKIPVKINFTVNYEQSLIQLEIFNHHNFGHIKRSYKSDEINDDFLDQLAKFLLRKKNDFIEIEMSHEERELLRENLRKNINFDTNPNRVKKEEPKKSPGLFGKVSSLFK